MGKKGGSAPTPPDPQETAAAEAQFNRLDTYSPSGSGVRYGYTDANGNFVQGPPPADQQSAVSYQENPFEQQIRQTLEPASVALTDRVVQDNIYGMPDAPRVQDRSDVASDLFNRTFSLMAPGIDKANERLLTNLQARGLPVGSEAFNDAYGEQQRQTQDTISRLAMDANLNAGSEQSRQFGLDQAERSGAIAELVAAMGGGYNPPNSVPSGNAPGVNYSGLVGQQYQAQLANYQQQQQQGMQTASALGSIGAALIKSTRSAKDVHGYANINGAAKIMANIPLHAWTYKPGEAPFGDHGGQHVGPMAEDFQRMTGLGAPDKIDATDYLGVLSAALQSALHRIAHLEAIIFEQDEEIVPAEKVRVH
ncbi:hypothetical protein [Tritonibacter mobilis]|uniref:hypothetical protein n=1 Tax=Tritonibacter mobilis TaxID=379347 RepID=UPI000E0D0956|nr:hypothetical protein [Tritonibacter mobilis]